MQTLLIVTNTSTSEDAFMESLLAGGLEKKDITPCNYKDAPLFINDPHYMLIFVELDHSQDLEESFLLLNQIKQANPIAKVIPVLHTKDSDLIIQLVKKGIDDVIIAPMDPMEVEKILETVQADPLLAAADGGSSGGKVITVTSYKGGTGVSTVAANLGFCLAEVDALSKKTLIIDLAYQSNHCARLLGANISMTINDLCKNIDSVGSAYIMSQCTWVTDNLALVGFSLSLDALVEDMDFNKLTQTIKTLSSSFDYVVIDLPTHTFDAKFLASIEVSDLIVITSTLDVTSITDTQNYINVLKDLGVEMNKIRIMINRYDSMTGLFNKQDLEKAFDHPVSFYVHNDYPTIIKAAQEQQAVLETDPRSVVAEDFAEISVGIDAGLSFVPIRKRGGKKKGLLSGLMSKLSK